MLRNSSPSPERSSSRRYRPHNAYKNSSLARRHNRRRAARSRTMPKQYPDTTPSQLPKVEFQFDLRSFESPKFLPSWCPPIPCFMTEQRPKFIDISHLPEPADSAIFMDALPTKQSRFFPSQKALPAPVVKLPPRELASFARTPSAVNLWNILMDIAPERCDSPCSWDSNWNSGSDESGVVMIPLQHDQYSEPQELDSREIPYTHPNSLLGYANDTAFGHSGSNDYEPLPADRVSYLQELLAPMDWESPNLELTAMPWPLVPRSQSPPPPLSDSIGSVPFIDNAEDVDTNTDADDLTRSLEHYTSERQLFEAEIPLPESLNGSECDLAMFLSMGHVENCWCRDCEELPVLVQGETPTPFREDDGWMVWSGAGDEEEVDPGRSDSTGWYDEYDWNV